MHHTPEKKILFRGVIIFKSVIENNFKEINIKAGIFKITVNTDIIEKPVNRSRKPDKAVEE